LDKKPIMFHGKSNRFSPDGRPIFNTDKTLKNPTKRFRAGVHHESLCNSETTACGGGCGERLLGKIAFIAKSWRTLLGYYLLVSEKGCTLNVL